MLLCEISLFYSRNSSSSIISGVSSLALFLPLILAMDFRGNQNEKAMITNIKTNPRITKYKAMPSAQYCKYIQREYLKRVRTSWAEAEHPAAA